MHTYNSPFRDLAESDRVASLLDLVSGKAREVKGYFRAVTKLTPESVVIKIDLPGVTRENVEVTLEQELDNKRVMVTSKRDDQEESSTIDFLVKEDVKAEETSAKLENGVLTIEIPRVVSEAVEPLRIEVQ